MKLSVCGELLVLALLACEVTSKGGRGGGRRGKGSGSSSFLNFFKWFRKTSDPAILTPKIPTTFGRTPHTNVAPKLPAPVPDIGPNKFYPYRPPPPIGGVGVLSNAAPRPPPYGGPPPPYPGLGSSKHSPPNLDPPPYSRGNYGYYHSGRHNSHHNSGHGYGGYYRRPHGGGNGSMENPHQWGRPGNPAHGPFGGGPYSASPHGTGFGFNQGIGGFGSHISTFIAGAMIWNLATDTRRNFHIHHINKEKEKHESDAEARIYADYGNMTCLTIYNAQKFAEWAIKYPNKTIKYVEDQTNQSYPFNLNLNETSIQFNFTLEPGKIIHNETISITCCGSEQIILDYEDAFKGRDPATNCVHLTSQIPFREVKVIPLNQTQKVTKKDIDSLLPSTTTEYSKDKVTLTFTSDFVDTYDPEEDDFPPLKKPEVIDIPAEKPKEKVVHVEKTTETNDLPEEKSSEETLDFSTPEGLAKYLEELRKTYKNMYPGINFDF